MIEYSFCDTVWTAEDVENGEPSETSEIFEDETTFHEMVEMLRTCHPSAEPIPDGRVGVWYTDGKLNDGTREYYEEGKARERSYFPRTLRAARYMRRAFLWTHQNARTR